MWTFHRYKTELLAAPMTFDYLLSEVSELAEAIRERSVAHTWEEWNDVMLCLMVWLARGLPFLWLVPIVPGLGLSSVRKFAARTQIWESILSHHGQEFRMELLQFGSNYRKQHKVARVLGMVGVTEVSWTWVEAKVGGFES